MVMPALIDDTLILCFEGTAKTLSALISHCIEKHMISTVDSHHTKYLLVHCKPQHMDVNPRENIPLEIFGSE